MRRDHKTLEPIAKKQAEKRDIYNKELMKKWLGTFLLATVILIYNRYKLKSSGKKWTFATTNLWLVVFGYLTEMFFFFGVIRQYEFYSDHKIYYNLYVNSKERTSIKLGCLDNV